MHRVCLRLCMGIYRSSRETWRYLWRQSSRLFSLKKVPSAYRKAAPKAITFLSSSSVPCSSTATHASGLPLPCCPIQRPHGTSVITAASSTTSYISSCSSYIHAQTSGGRNKVTLCDPVLEQLVSTYIVKWFSAHFLLFTQASMDPKNNSATAGATLSAQAYGWSWRPFFVMSSTITESAVIRLALQNLLSLGTPW